MRTTSLLLFILIPLFFSTLAYADNRAKLREILYQYTESMGGSAKLRLLKSVKITGILVSEEEGKDVSIPITVIKKLPDYSITHMDFGTREIITGSNGNVAWRKAINQLGETHIEIITGDEKISIMRNAPITSILLNTDRNGAKLTLLEEKKEVGKLFHRIKASFISGDSAVYWIDKELYQDYKVEFYNTQGEWTRNLYPGKFEIYDGVLFSMRSILKEANGSKSVLEIEKIETNIGVLDIFFDPPQKLSQAD